MDSDLQLDLLKKLLDVHFPEIIAGNNNDLSLNKLTQLISQYFSQKLNDNIRDLLDSLDVKYSDVDTAISILSRHVDSMAVMDSRELLIYKVLPCPFGERCPKRPAEIVSHNEYMDKYLECPFYHHNKDRRRICRECSNDQQEDFIYKAIYKKKVIPLAIMMIIVRTFMRVCTSQCSISSSNARESIVKGHIYALSSILIRKRRSGMRNFIR